MYIVKTLSEFDAWLASKTAPLGTGELTHMTKKISISKLPEFDLARQLNSEADIAAYITMVIEEGDAAELAHALGVATRARGMTMLPC